MSSLVISVAVEELGFRPTDISRITASSAKMSHWHDSDCQLAGLQGAPINKPQFQPRIPARASGTHFPGVDCLLMSNWDAAAPHTTGVASVVEIASLKPLPFSK